jgi:hypothetical protein
MPQCRSSSSVQAADNGGGHKGKASESARQEAELLRENQILRSAVRCLAEYVPEEVRTELLEVHSPLSPTDFCHYVLVSLSSFTYGRDSLHFLGKIICTM